MRLRNIALGSVCVWASAACAGADAGPSEDDGVDVATVASVRDELRAAMGSKESHFADQEALQKALSQVAREFKDAQTRKTALTAYENAVEHIDRFQIFTLARLGKTWLGDQVVISDEILLGSFRASTASAAPVASDSSGSIGTTRQALEAYPPSQVQQNLGEVYKTQGESFVDNFIAYKQAGALTQFKKHRKRFWVTGWYDTDASKIAVQVYYFGNPDRDIFPAYRNTSFAMSEGSDHNSGDDYVSDRELCFGGSITYRLDSGGGVNPTPSPIFTVGCYEGIYALHAVDHAGYKWRLSSSKGLRAQIEWGSIRPGWSVPWES